MSDPRTRFQRAEAANDAAAEHLRRMREFLAESRRQLEELKGDVERTNEHLAVSRRFIEASEDFLRQHRMPPGAVELDESATDEPLSRDR